jgi:hypothetical protein
MHRSKSVGIILLCILIALLPAACVKSAANPPAAVQPTSAAPAAPATSVPQPAAPTTQPATAATSPSAASSEQTPAGAPGSEGTRGPLSVVIYSPQDGAVVNTADINVVGEADPDTVISINDDIVLTGPERKFSAPLHLDEGPNIIEITASDDNGNQGTIYLTIFYDTQS